MLKNNFMLKVVFFSVILNSWNYTAEPSGSVANQLVYPEVPEDQPNDLEFSFSTVPFYCSPSASDSDDLDQAINPLTYSGGQQNQERRKADGSFSAAEAHKTSSSSVSDESEHNSVESSLSGDERFQGLHDSVTSRHGRRERILKRLEDRQAKEILEQDGYLLGDTFSDLKQDDDMLIGDHVARIQDSQNRSLEFASMRTQAANVSLVTQAMPLEKINQTRKSWFCCCGSSDDIVEK